MNDCSFQLGEVALFRDLPAPFHTMNGSECEIVGELEHRFVFDLHGKKGISRSYMVMYRGMRAAALPANLRKRPSKPESKDADFGKVVEWDDCAWSPETEAA